MTLDDLIDISAGLVSGRVLRGSRLGILTSTGGGGSLIADASGIRGFHAPPPDSATADRLREALVGEAAMADRNPIDLTLANLRGETYRQTITALVDSPSYDGVVVVVGSSGLGDPSLAAAPVREAATAAEKPVVVYVNPHALNIVKYLNSVGVPAFSTAEGCAAALAAMRDRVAAIPDRVSADSLESGVVLQIPQPSHGGGPGPPTRSGERRSAPLGRRLNEAEALALFAEHGIQVVRHAVAQSPDEAAHLAATLGSERVVVKVLAREVAHKSDVGGVRVGVAPADVASACRELAARVGDAHLEGWLVQEQVIGGTELLLGSIRDAQLGPALVLGAGGVATEVFGDSTLRLLPLGADDPREMLVELRCRVLLEGFRVQPPGDIAALFEAMRRFAALVESFGERLLEAEINPLFVLPQRAGVVAADALVVLAG
jgi:acetate---CoA ligase (ADP-forming)